MNVSRSLSGSRSYFKKNMFLPFHKSLHSDTVENEGGDSYEARGR